MAIVVGSGSWRNYTGVAAMGCVHRLAQGPDRAGRGLLTEQLLVVCLKLALLGRRQFPHFLNGAGHVRMAWFCSAVKAT